MHLTLIYHHGATGLYSSRGLYLRRKKSFNPNNICISDRSILRAERTRKPLAQNSRVLSRFSYIAYTQRVTSTSSKNSKIRKLKKAPFCCKRTTLVLPMYPFCIADVVVLHCKCSRFAQERGLEWWKKRWWRLGNAIKPAIEISIIDFSFVTLFYCIDYICI